jgi:hypothetical protein
MRKFHRGYDDWETKWMGALWVVIGVGIVMMLVALLAVCAR